MQNDKAMTLYATRLEHGAGVAGNVSSKIFKILPDMRGFRNSLEMDVFFLSGKRKQPLIQLQDTDENFVVRCSQCKGNK